MWVGTDYGAYWVDEDLAQHPIPGVGATVWIIQEIQDEVWLGTNEGAYRVTRNPAPPTPEVSPKASAALKGNEASASKIWAGTDEGANRGEHPLRVE